MTIQNLIGECIDKDLEFCAFRSPRGKLQLYIQRIKTEESKQGTKHIGSNAPAPEKYFMVRPFGTDDKVIKIGADIVIGEDDIEKHGTEIQEIENYRKDRTHNTPVPQKETKVDEKRQEWEKCYEKTMNELRDGEIKKIVLSHPIVVNGNYKERTPEIFGQLCHEFTDSFVALCNTQQYGLWMGATPETFLIRHGAKTRTIALAGTRKTGERVWDPKNIEEHEFVCRFIEKILAEENIKIENKRRKTKSAGRIEHIETDYDFECSDETAGELAEKLHPTPATCGYPQRESYELLTATEPYKRELYCGYWGPYAAKDNFELYVNLRCMKIEEECVTLYAGGGITAQSEKEKEWNETLLKADTLRRFL